METRKCHHEAELLFGKDCSGSSCDCQSDCSTEPTVQESKLETSYITGGDMIANGNAAISRMSCNMKNISDNERNIESENSLSLDSLSLTKVEKIIQALLLLDTKYLQTAAIEPGGLVNDYIRQKVWPKLLDLDLYATSPKPSTEEVESHPYYQQVLLDVNRSLKRFPPSIKEKQRLTMQDQLVLLIMRVLVKHPSLHYYQGYHDICVTFLLVLGEEMAFHIVDKLSITHLSEFMKETMEPTSIMLNYMYPVLYKEKPHLGKFMEESNVGVIFALSWLITWFSHVLNNYSDVVRLFDFFIASSEWMPVYLSTAIVLYREVEILKEECEISCIHSLLLNIPDDLPFEQLIVKSIELYRTYPPQSLKDDVMKKMVEEEKLRLQLRQTRRKSGIVYTVCKTIWHVLPRRKLPLVVATVVLLWAIYYQTYKI